MNNEDICKYLIDLLEKDTLTKKDMKRLEEYSYSEESSIRVDVAANLCYNNKKALEILLRLIHDGDDMVRVEACDAIRANPSEEAFELLGKLMFSDSYTLVRRYATLSYVDIALLLGKNYDEVRKHVLKLLSSKQSDIGIKISCYRGLYLIGDEEYLDKIIKEIKGEDSNDRCAAIKILAEISNKDNKKKISAALIKRLRKEREFAVTSTIGSALEEINNKEHKK